MGISNLTCFLRLHCKHGCCNNVINWLLFNHCTWIVRVIPIIESDAEQLHVWVPFTAHWLLASPWPSPPSYSMAMALTPVELALTRSLQPNLIHRGDLSLTQPMKKWKSLTWKSKLVSPLAAALPVYSYPTLMWKVSSNASSPLTQQQPCSQRETMPTSSNHSCMHIRSPPVKSQHPNWYLLQTVCVLHHDLLNVFHWRPKVYLCQPLFEYLMAKNIWLRHHAHMSNFMIPIGFLNDLHLTYDSHDNYKKVLDFACGSTDYAYYLAPRCQTIMQNGEHINAHIVEVHIDSTKATEFCPLLVTTAENLCPTLKVTLVPNPKHGVMDKETVNKLLAQHYIQAQKTHAVMIVGIKEMTIQIEHKGSMITFHDLLQTHTDGLIDRVQPTKLLEEQGCYLLITNEECMDCTIKTINDIFNWLKVKGKEESLRMVGQEIKCLYHPKKIACIHVICCLTVGTPQQGNSSNDSAPSKGAMHKMTPVDGFLGEEWTCMALPPRHPVQTCQDDNQRWCHHANHDYPELRLCQMSPSNLQWNPAESWIHQKTQATTQNETIKLITKMTMQYINKV